MRAVLLYSIYSGQLFFVVVAALLVVVTLDLLRCLDGRPLARRAAGLVALLAIPLGVFAAPPIPLLIALVTLLATTLYVFGGFAKESRRIALGWSAAALCIVATAFELPYHVTRNKTPRPQQLYVIGDSLSSGGFGEIEAWPELLGRQVGLPVTNLALASADGATALERQVPQLPAPSSSAGVLIAIGGNDMLDGTPLRQFEDDLDRVMAAARANGKRPVIVLELPLLPGRWSYGAVQRRLARKHDCVLVPKRILAKALLKRGNTFDGLHLTQQGHEDLARMLSQWLGWRPHVR